MTPTEQQRCREAFEEWYYHTNGNLYCNPMFAYEAWSTAFQAAWQAQEERTQKLVEALKLATKELAFELNAAGDCDHQIGICCCDLKRAISACEEALAAH